MEELPPKASLSDVEEFERKRCGYFADDYSKTALYWSSLREAMSANDGSTDQVLSYVAGKLETDRVYTSSIYANADKVFGDKKGAAKLRHDHIRHAEQKAKMKGEDPPVLEDAMVAGGAGSEQPANSTVRAIWEMAEMDCRAARHRDVLCDELEEEDLLGKVKVMGKETRKRFQELIVEGESCLLSLRNIDKQVGQQFIHLKEILGSQLGGTALHEDVWFLECRYRTAVVHQKEAWEAVNKKLKEVFVKMKDLECQRRQVLRDFMIGANKAIGASWGKLPALCGPACDSANRVDASKAVVDSEVAERVSAMAATEKRTDFELVDTTHMAHADPAPADMSFIDNLTAPLESPLVRHMMMVERREGNAMRSKYYPGLMVLSWQGFIHFFDLPESSKLQKDASPAAAFQDISPTISLDDLVQNRKDLDEVLLFRSTYTLELDVESLVEGVSSKKSHKLEVKGKKSSKNLFGTSNKTVTFRTSTEAEMNHALEHIKECIQALGGMLTEGASAGRPSLGGRSSFGSVKSDGSTKEVPAATDQAPVPAPSSTVPSPAPAPETTPASTTDTPAAPP